MARSSYNYMMLIYALAAFLAMGAQASDPEATVDFVLPPGMAASDVNGSFLTFTGFRGHVGGAVQWSSSESGSSSDKNCTAGAAGSSTFIKPVKAFVNDFPALSGLGISAAFLEFQPGTMNPPHTHPRGTELLFVLDGSLVVGLVDTSNKLYNQTLQKGDLFVFPKGLVHFQTNPSSCYSAHALATFSSSSPGAVSLPSTLFNSSIPSAVLAKAFQVSDDTISTLEAPFQMVHIDLLGW